MSEPQTVLPVREMPEVKEVRDVYGRRYRVGRATGS